MIVWLWCAKIRRRRRRRAARRRRARACSATFWWVVMDVDVILVILCGKFWRKCLCCIVWVLVWMLCNVRWRVKAAGDLRVGFWSISLRRRRRKMLLSKCIILRFKVDWLLFVLSVWELVKRVCVLRFVWRIWVVCKSSFVICRGLLLARIFVKCFNKLVMLWMLLWCVILILVDLRVGVLCFLKFVNRCKLWFKVLTASSWSIDWCKLSSIVMIKCVLMIFV